jgi:16S rRNA (uracil1498-N3)-methyltransferase
MSEPRVFVDLDLNEGDTVSLPAEVHRHLVVVLRRIRGDVVILFNGRGGEYSAELESVGKRNATARIIGYSGVSRESRLGVTLAQAVSKGERMDYTIQKAVELGVTDIQPLVTDHVVVKLTEERWQRKQEHWQSIAIAACEQSGRTRVPKIAPVVDIRDWLPQCPPDALKLMLALGAETLLGELKHRDEPVLLLVGPEGDFSDMEKHLADMGGFQSLSLGPRLLRTETAGVVALSVMQALWGDLGLKGK